MKNISCISATTTPATAYATVPRPRPSAACFLGIVIFITIGNVCNIIRKKNKNCCVFTAERVHTSTQRIVAQDITTHRNFFLKKRNINQFYVQSEHSTELVSPEGVMDFAQSNCCVSQYDIGQLYCSASLVHPD